MPQKATKLRNAAETAVNTVVKTFRTEQQLPPGTQEHLRNLQTLLKNIETEKHASPRCLKQIEHEAKLLIVNIKVYHLRKTKDSIVVKHLSSRQSGLVPLYVDGFNSRVILLSDVHLAHPGQHLCVKYAASAAKHERLAPIKDYDSRQPLVPERYNIEQILQQGKTYNGIFCDSRGSGGAKTAARKK